MIDLKYSFKFSELKYINKFVFANKLRGLPKTIMPCLKTKRSMIKSGVLEDSKELKMESVYSQLFQDWADMKYIVTIPNQGRHKLYTYTILNNDKRIVTVEEDDSCIDVGYFFYEYYGYRDYLLRQLGLNFELKVVKDIDFYYQLNEEDFEKFMSYNLDLLHKVSEETGIDYIILGGLTTQLYEDECKVVYAENLTTGSKAEFKIYSNKAANFWYKKVFDCNGCISYYIGITNTPRLLREIQNFE